MKLPQGVSASELARYSMKQWQDLDGFYNYWTEKWRRNMDFIRGQHWNKTQLVPQSTLAVWEEFPEVDFTLSVYTDYLRQWMEARIRFSAAPESPTPKEISSAQLADHVLRYLWDKHVDKLRADLGAWLMSTGNGNIRVFWNTNTGNLLPLAIPNPETGELVPINPETLQPDPSMQQPIMIDAGDIGIEVVSPQLVRWPFDTAHGVQIGYLLSYDEAEARFGKEIAEKIRYEKSYQGLSNDLMTLGVPGSQSGADEKALVIEQQLPRSYKYPQGQWWTSCGTELVTPPAPLPIGKGAELSVIPFRWVPMPGHPTMGLTPLSGVRNANKLYEKSLKRDMEWANKIIPKMLKPAGSGIRDGELSESREPGTEHTHNPGAAPTYTMMPQPSSIFKELRDEAANNLQVVGMYRFSRAQKELPPGVGQPTVRAPQAMIGAGQEVSLAIMNAKESWEKIAYTLLGYVGTFYTEPRVMGVVGPDRAYQWREFTGSDLKDLQATIRVDETSLYTWNRESTRDTVLALLASPAGGVLFAGPDGPDRDKIENAMEAAGLDEGFQTIDPDVLEARNELSLFQGAQSAEQFPQMMPWQNHEIHISEKSKVIKGMEFKGWPQPNQQGLLQNISQHEQAVAQAQKAAQDAQIEYEAKLREVRAAAESAANVRSALGEKLVEILGEALSPEEEKDEGKSDSDKKSKSK